MPLEIRELVIRVNVINNPPAAKTEVDLNVLKREVIAECLDYLQDELERRNSR